MKKVGKKQRTFKEEITENIGEDLEMLTGDEDESSFSAINLKEEEISEHVCEDLVKVIYDIRSLCPDESSPCVSVTGSLGMICMRNIEGRIIQILLGRKGLPSQFV